MKHSTHYLWMLVWRQGHIDQPEKAIDTSVLTSHTNRDRVYGGWKYHHDRLAKEGRVQLSWFRWPIGPAYYRLRTFPDEDGYFEEYSVEQNALLVIEAEEKLSHFTEIAPLTDDDFDRLLEHYRSRREDNQ